MKRQFCLVVLNFNVISTKQWKVIFLYVRCHGSVESDFKLIEINNFGIMVISSIFVKSDTKWRLFITTMKDALRTGSYEWYIWNIGIWVIHLINSAMKDTIKTCAWVIYLKKRIMIDVLQFNHLEETFDR